LNARFDENQLRAILDALIENAVKFTPVGSKIRMHVREAMEDGERWARIDVEDDGPGIPSAQLPTLFEPFRQVDGSMTRKEGGMGIGLALALQLAEGLGGRLTAKSVEGGGSCFSLFLPTELQYTGKPADDPGRKGLAMSNDLSISEADNGGRATVLRLKGRLDVKTSPVLLQRAAEVQANGQNLVLNLSEVSFIGSSGIGALLVLVEQFQEQAGVVRLVSPSPAVEAVIKLLNLDRFLAVDPSEEKALAEIDA
jgi:anti-anti-sigma factor